jgi:signal transduction histidine kinase
LAIERKQVDMGDLARRVVAAVEPAAAGKDVHLSLRIAPEPPTVSVDADRISQVLHNLLGNALRHTPAGGQITLAVGVASDHQSPNLSQRDPVGPISQFTNLPISQSPNLPVVVTVSDTGPGIPPEDLPYIFDRFYRADKSRSRTGGGSGLGLTIARYIVEAHGGRIWAESRVGQGTNVLFTIPPVG